MLHHLINPNRTGLPSAVKASPLLTQVWDGLDPSQLWDCHAHLIGTGDSGGGAWTHPHMDSLRHPAKWLHKRVFLNASGVRQPAKGVDRQVVGRMQEMLTDLRGAKIMLLAFDYAHSESGRAQPAESLFHVPNHYAAAAAARHPAHFEWVASVHPYRPDAVAQVYHAVANGARAMKWLPSAHAIDPASPRCLPFYRALADTGLPLITHAGREQAVPGGRQEDGNPLKLRTALDAGVKVVIAHCASDGKDRDLDQGTAGPVVRSFDLFARLMDDPQYQDRLFADISAIALRTRVWALKAVLERPDWHARLLNGSDHPLPGVMPLHSARAMARAGLLEPEHAPFLNAIKPMNPLLFDLCLKRLARWQGNAFPVSVFETRPFFSRSQA